MLFSNYLKNINPWVKRIGNVFFALSIVFIGVLVFSLVQSKLAGGLPRIGGYEIYIVSSGSMSPAINTGSIVFVKPIDPSEIQVGDIITFEGNAGEGSLTTHRVVDVNEGESRSFITRGDANNMDDPSPVPGNNLVGKVTGHMPAIGYLLGFVQTKPGIILFIYIPALFIMIMEFINLYKYAGEYDKENGGEEEEEGTIPEENGAV